MAYRSEEDRQRRVEYAREVREYRKSLGMCERCGKERVAVNSKRLCLDCLEVNRQKQETRWRSKTSEERRRLRDKYNASRREQQDQRRKEGLCVECGKPVYDGHSTCIEHYLYHRRRHEASRNQKKKGYKELGLCINCGKECVPGKKYCPEHYQKKVEAAKWAGEHRNTKKHTWNRENDMTFRRKEGGRNE